MLAGTCWAVVRGMRREMARERLRRRCMMAGSVGRQVGGFGGRFGKVNGGYDFVVIVVIESPSEAETDDTYIYIYVIMYRSASILEEKNRHVRTAGVFYRSHLPGWVLYVVCGTPRSRTQRDRSVTGFGLASVKCCLPQALKMLKYDQQSIVVVLSYRGNV